MCHRWNVCHGLATSDLVLLTLTGSSLPGSRQGRLPVLPEDATAETRTFCVKGIGYSTDPGPFCFVNQLLYITFEPDLITHYTENFF